MTEKLTVINSKEVSEFLRVEESKVLEMVNEYEIPFVKIKGELRFILEHLEPWLIRNTTKPAKELYNSIKRDFKIVDHVNKTKNKKI